MKGYSVGETQSVQWIILVQSVFDAYALYLQPGRHTVGTNMVQSEAPAELTQVGTYF